MLSVNSLVKFISPNIECMIDDFPDANLLKNNIFNLKKIKFQLNKELEIIYHPNKLLMINFTFQ